MAEWYSSSICRRRSASMAFDPGIILPRTPCAGEGSFESGRNLPPSAQGSRGAFARNRLTPVRFHEPRGGMLIHALQHVDHLVPQHVTQHVWLRIRPRNLTDAVEQQHNPSG